MERRFEGPLSSILPRLENFIKDGIITKRPIPVSIFREKDVYNYPYKALRELMMNALMHRDYQANTPTRLYQFDDHIEILNPGGLYGEARPENFPNVNDYRNSVLAEMMKTLNYVNMFNHGIREVKSQLAENGNPAPEFKVDYITAFAVEIPVAKDDEPAVNSGVGEKSDQVTAQVSDQGAKNIVENITESIVENIVVKLSTMRAEIVRIIWRTPQATAETIAKAVNIAPRNVQVHLRKLQEQGVIRRVGPDKGGHWEIIDTH